MDAVLSIGRDGNFQAQRKFSELDEGTIGEERKGTYVQGTVTLSSLYLIGSIYLENPD